MAAVKGKNNAICGGFQLSAHACHQRFTNTKRKQNEQFVIYVKYSIDGSCERQTK